MFLVLGETARAQNYSALGYETLTNPFSAKENVISFSVRSCGTATAYSVPCMFSNLTREEYSPKLVENCEGILDVLQKAGIDVAWLENDEGCKGVCDRVKNIWISPDGDTDISALLAGREPVTASATDGSLGCGAATETISADGV